MKNKKLKSWVVPCVYLTALIMVIGSIYLTISSINNYFSDKNDFNYSINGMTKTPLYPVQGTETKKEETTSTNIIRPYKSDKVEIGRYFYDKDSSEELQQKSIIYYENTYMQNTGVDYISDESFEIINVLPGKVLSVENDEILGNIIKIEHDKNFISVYEGIDNIKVKEGDTINENTVIATSGTSLINNNFKNSLHFEVYYNGKLIDPEKFYTININEL